MDAKQAIAEGKTILGIELGSTRIKAVLINENNTPIATGSHDWENKLESGIWTYNLDDVWAGLQNCFGSLVSDVKTSYGLSLDKIGAIGISAMMHGYLVFDKNGKQLVPFRTWRNTITEKAASHLSDLFQFSIPQRWSIAHLYQAILNKENHINDIAFITTLAGYVHWKLTGKKVLGLGDASGVFPVDDNNYNSRMLGQFNELVAPNAFSWKIAGILPDVLNAGESAGSLTEEGVKLLDSRRSLKTGIPFCPPEGDTSTGMVATNSITERTGNISAGTSIFAMIVMEKSLSKLYPEIDMVVTPTGKPVAMVHCNNCTTDLDAWVQLFMELLEKAGAGTSKTALYKMLYNLALNADADCGGLLSYNYFSGEHMTGIEEGRPLFARMPDSSFNLANFMRTHLFASLATLKYGIDILAKENIRIDSLLGHGGLFKTKGVGQRFMAAAFNAPVSVIEESAGEGGAWGIALLASFMLQGGGSLDNFLSEKVFASAAAFKIEPNPKDVDSFRQFMERYTIGLNIERAAVENMRR